MMAIRKRLCNIMRRMSEGEDFWLSHGTPTIKRSEINELEALGLIIQTEHTHGAEAYSPVAAYPLRLAEFQDRAEKILSGGAI